MSLAMSWYPWLLVKDALLPVWSTDGARVAYLQKVGRKKYVVGWVPVTR
jgi:hypothetical protein